MIHVYLDESGQDFGATLCTVAGWAGPAASWRSFDEEWHAKRKPMPSLHLSSLRWNRKKNDSLRRLLSKLARIPYAHGLKPVAAQMLQSTYRDCVKGKTESETVNFMWTPYMSCLQVCIEVVIQEGRVFPIEFFAERQDRYSFAAQVFSDVLRINAKDFVGEKLFGPTYLPSGSTPGLEVADYLTYALAQHELDPNGIRARLTGPILEGGVVCRELTPEWVGNCLAKVNAMDGEAEFEKALRGEL